MNEFADTARALIAENKYMVLGTADASGTPWTTPVFFSPDGHRDFYWVSGPTTRHSRNIAGRPEVSITVFDSRCEIGTAEAVYMSATAAEVPADEHERALRIFNAKLDVARHFTVAMVREPDVFRLYRARVTEHSVLIGGSHPLNGKGHDSRVVVDLTA
ncbi:pyridoxamine 5'-phosphate oxidase family protein [Phytomonospora endophytica]|uniref:Nitroimidazol reductase NimA-like FMN-containing flavoprotein (Pyridoxamine 5'-phosphate oxidase superfamily) n=1 Tax=Phytomonospora endophytica TaxID=714109 RepID=A0A841FKR8_9ACTN|nr:pyridoxamine 5'-phosphate oxidase family protein [Phytomonospora endophytica]MBB6036756.1 nitroimidazol reductase NimA-like FMN-containing flavoprotein (pyridoxamine 5'-phosphate oxidase superfamily) [Phytomonospora endophytica]GIG68210.1 hypothetical protein Pen01_45050 [Phytomonospora endophytica]